MGGRNGEMGAKLQEIGQEMFSKTFLHTIVAQRNTPTQLRDDTNTAQRFLTRRTLLPTHTTLLQTVVASLGKQQQEMKTKQEIQAKYCDKCKPGFTTVRYG